MPRKIKEPTELETVQAEGQRLRTAVMEHVQSGGGNIQIDALMMRIHVNALREVLLAAGLLTVEAWELASARAYRDLFAAMLQSAEDQSLATPPPPAPSPLALPPGARRGLAVVRH